MQMIMKDYIFELQRNEDMFDHCSYKKKLKQL